jgi:cephalosporin hydroxylase
MNVDVTYAAPARTIPNREIMRIVIDEARQTLTRSEPEGERPESFPLYSREAFEIVSRVWVKVGWSQKHDYTFTWFGRPIIQLPEDVIRIQEVIYATRPDVIVETGVAHGGSLVFYASLFQAMGRGRVVGVELALRSENRKAIVAHELASRITLVDGSSTSSETVSAVRNLIEPGERVMVILDSNHTRAHVAAELDAYANLVSEGCYLVATDGIMRDLHDVPRGRPEWRDDNPSSAAEAFAVAHPEFDLGQPPWPFSESDLRENVTHWPSAWLRRRGGRG